MGRAPADAGPESERPVEAEAAAALAQGMAAPSNGIPINPAAAARPIFPTAPRRRERDGGGVDPVEGPACG
jgi:hypothetical protein